MESDPYDVIYEKAPVKLVILRLNEDSFWYLWNLIESDTPHWEAKAKEMLQMMKDIRAEIDSHD